MKIFFETRDFKTAPVITSYVTYLHPISFLDHELEILRGENRRNMVLSVALLAISALFYYTFVY